MSKKHVNDLPINLESIDELKVTDGVGGPTIGRVTNAKVETGNLIVDIVIEDPKMIEKITYSKPLTVNTRECIIKNH